MRRDLLFDLDQTLLDFHASERIALKMVMEEKGLGFSEERCEFFKRTNKGLWLRFEKDEITKKELFDSRFRRLFEECGCDTRGMDMLRINDDFISFMSENGVLMEGALGFLRRLREDIPSARIYIITNGVERNALGRINSTGLSGFTERVFVSETLGASKPSEEYFRKVIDAVGDPKESCLVIGDSLTSDMLGARNAGLKSCWFMPEGDAEKAVKEYDIDYTAGTFDELYEVIKRWTAGD